MPSSVQKLAAEMHALVIRENTIKAINGSTLDAFTLKTTKEIGDLQPEQNLLLPGGWSGIDSPGHAMIYQFEKDAHGDLLFSIYNSGSGISQHEKTSSTKKELYSPVKTYKFPNPVDPIELQHLIKRITVPQLTAGHPARNYRKFDAKQVYTNIETSLEFMKAKLVPEDLNASHATTGRQLSGTCSQRSIHQLLKVSFDELPEYQRFIFDFKMYALKDFIKTHPLPRAPEITVFIQKAITNNLRVLQEPGVFNDADEQARVVKTLEALKYQLQTKKPPVRTSFWPKGIDLSPLLPRAPEITVFIQKAITNNLRVLQEPGVFNDADEQARVVKTLEALKYQLQTKKPPVRTSFWPKGIDLSPLWNLFTNAPVPDKLTANMAVFETSERAKLPTYQPLVPDLHQDHLLSDLSLIIERCKAQQDTNPAWVMAQIEQAILALPIPSSSFLAPPYYEKIPFYDAITTADDLETIGKTIDELQHLYRHASEKLLKDATLPTQAVTYCSFLALRDYFDATGEAVTGKPAFHSFLHTMLCKYLNTFRSYPFLATNNPAGDKRWTDLLTLTHRSTTMQASPKILSDKQALLALLDADPYLKAYLESQPDNEIDDVHILELLEEYPELRKKSALPTDEGARLKKYQQMMHDDYNIFVNLKNENNAKENLEYGNKHIPKPSKYYRSLLNSEPVLKMKLERVFESRQYSHDKLYSELRTRGLTALYVLLTELDESGALNPDSTLSFEEFKPLINKIQQHFALEKALITYLEPLQSTQKGKKFSCLTSGRSTEDREIPDPWSHDPFSQWEDKTINSKYCDYQLPLRPQEKASITQHKYNFTDSLARSALIKSHVYCQEGSGSRTGTILDAKNSNQIQTLPPDKKNQTVMIDKDQYFGRDLFHLRMSSAHQITLTLDYFSKSESLGKLQDPNIQSYVEANLFEPGLLLDALKNDPTFLARFDSFIEKGLRYFSGPDGLLTGESLFFIRLKTYVHRYAELNGFEEGLHLLRDNHGELDRLITVERDPAMLACLHTIRFLNAISLHQREGVDSCLLQEAFLSNFYQQATYNPFTPNDTASIFEQQRARVYFSEWLRDADPALIQSLITPTMIDLGFDVSHLTITGTYPSFHYQDQAGTTIYTVNAEQGRVFQGNFSFSSIPLDIKRHPIAHRLGLQQETSCWVSEDENLIRFKSGNVRIKRDGSRLIVQKKWNNQWYQLTPLNDKQQALFGLDTASVPTNKLAAILTDGSSEAWVNENNVLIVNNNKPIYQVDKSGVFHQLNEAGQLNGCILAKAPTAFEKALTQFESPDFFNVNLNETRKTKGTVDFARFGFSLTIEGKKITLPNTNYALMDSSSWASNVAALTFSNGIDEQCMVAVHPFYIDESTLQEPGKYYHLTHDKSGHVPDAMLAKSDSEKKQPIWNHHHSQRAITYKIVDGKPKPETAADALYLCYVYLASHETDKAWEVLDGLSKRLSFVGSTDELLYLSWIVEALPTVLDTEKDAERKFATPEYVSCQLKALALYTDFLKLGKAPAIELDKPVDSTYANGIYQRQCVNKISAFKDGLESTIYNLYSKYQRQERHLHEKYTLQDEESRTLLNCCDPNQHGEKPIAYGALGYERRRLSLKTLLKEYQRLVAVRDTSPDFPSELANRLANIEKNITHELKVMKKSTQLEWVDLDLQFHDPLDMMHNPAPLIINQIYEDNLSLKAKNSFEQWQCNVFMSPLNLDAALGALNSDIKQDDFMHYFPTYLHIARSGTPEQTAALKEFCIHYLIGFRHVYPESEEGNVRHLTNILYHVLENPSTYSSLEEEVGLYDLRKMTEQCEINPIAVAEAKDVYDEILTSNQDIWDALSTEFAASEHMPPLAAMHLEPLWQMLGMKDSLQAYRDEENEYTVLMQDIEDELTAGQLKFKCQKQQRVIAETVFQDADVRAGLAQQATALETTQQKELIQLWGKALAQANKPPEHAIKLIAEQRHVLTKEELLSLYLHADLTRYIEKTGLSKQDCLDLHQLIHQGVSLEVQHQQVTRLLTALKSSEPHQIAAILMAENTPKAQTDPGLMLFQYAEDILARPRQGEALVSLLSTPDDPRHFNNVIEKVIMGGGKSKVILPIMAEKKATGLNLVVVEVPRALLATNHVDLNATSQRLFGQKAHRFEFNRDSDCSAKRLQTIHETFVEIMTNKAYLVTTGEAMQSLELKYLDLLLSRSEDPLKLDEWKKQVYWASKITGLVKSCGDVVIDEVHQGLLLKKKLNYTLGDFSSISPELIKQSIALHQFVNVGPRPNLPEALLTHPDSPLHDLMNALKKTNPGVDVVSELRAYFNNKTMPHMIEKASNEIKDTMAFYKEQLTLLPRTQARHYKEHYGPSQTQDTALKRALAIPYIASNQPSERSRFGNPLEIINYSIQGLLNEGLNEDLLKTAIRQWQAESCAELTLSKTYKALDDTPTAIRINALLQGTGLTLGSINLRTERGEKEFFPFVEQLKTRQTLLFAILEEQILPQIATEPSVLHSDAYNHVDMYRTAQGLSGTPWNHSTYHQRLTFNSNTSLGTDGYIETVLKEKKTTITPISFTTMDEFLSTLFNGQPETRAIIDISATFAGFSNLDVAKKLAINAAKFNPTIQYILYFDQHDVLCALNVKTQQPIVLATSNPDEIKQKIGCTPNECLTYYDQSHTVGTDLKQAPMAHAFVLADNRTHLESFLQGCLRMRGMDEQQTLSIIVPENTPTSLDEFMALMARNEHDQLKEDNFFAALAKMDNVIRQDCLQRLAAVPDEDVDKKYKLAQAFKDYFVETNSHSLFEQYGGISVERLTLDLLKEHHDALMLSWEGCLLDSDILPMNDDRNALNATLSAVVQAAIPLCNEKTMSRNNQQALGIEVEHEQEAQQEAEKEKLKEAESFNSELRSAARHNWKAKDKDSLSPLTAFITNGSSEYMHPLNEPAGAQCFSNNLLVDDNYAKVYAGQQKMLNPFLKPVMPILFRQCGDTVTACLIDMDDLLELHSLIKDEGDIKVWISTTQHGILSGHFPDNIRQNKDYQALIEEIQLFNGELNGLREQNTPRSWLNQEGSEKLAYFHEHIMPYRQTVLSEVNNLQTALSSAISIDSSSIKKMVSISTTQQMRTKVQNRQEIDVVSQVSHLSAKKT